MLRRALPPGAEIDGLATQRQGFGYDHGASSLGGIQRVQRSEIGREYAASVGRDYAASVGGGGSPLVSDFYMPLAGENGPGRCPSGSAATRAQHHKFSCNVGDGGFLGAVQQQERFPTVPASAALIARRGEVVLAGGGAGARNEMTCDGFVAAAGGGTCTMQHSQNHRSACAREEDTAAAVVTASGDHNGWKPNSRSTPPQQQQLQELSVLPHPSAGAHTPDSFEGVHQQQSQQQQQYGRRYQQLHPNGQDHPRYGHGGAHGGGDEQQSPPVGVERLNTATTVPGRGLNSGPHARNGPSHNRVHSSAATFVYSNADTAARSQTPGTATYLVEPSFRRSPSSSMPLHARSRSDGRYDRERVALAARPSAASNMNGPPSHGHAGRRENAQRSHSHGQHEVFVNGRWQGVGVVDPGGGGGGEDGYHSAGLGSHPEQPPSDAVRPSVTSSYCRGFNVTRCAGPHHHPQQLDQRSAYPSAGGETNVNAFNGGGAPGRTTVESPPVGSEHHQRIAGVARNASFVKTEALNCVLTPADPVAAAERKASPDAIVRPATACGGNSMASSLGSPVAPATLRTPKNPFEWLQNLRHVRTGTGNEKGSSTPRTSRSSSMSSHASPSRLASFVGGADGRSFHQRSDSMLRGAGTCPAPDCPGNGDCLPGATPDMLVYEVKFKRATRTFLPGDFLSDTTISCGDRMKVR